MRVYQILEEKNNLDEAPVGALKQIGRRIGSKAAGAVGMSRTAGNLGAKADTGKEANNVEKGFHTFLGKIMKSPKEATAQDLAKYLKQSGYPIDALKGMSGILQPKQVDDLILKSVAAKAGGADVPGVGGTDSGKGSGSGGSGSGSGGSGGGSFLDKAQAKTGKTGVGGGTVGNKSGGSDGGTDSSAGDAGIPQNIQQKLDKLTPDQKKELASML